MLIVYKCVNIRIAPFENQKHFKIQMQNNIKRHKEGLIIVNSVWRALLLTCVEWTRSCQTLRSKSAESNVMSFSSLYDQINTISCSFSPRRSLADDRFSPVPASSWLMERTFQFWLLAHFTLLNLKSLQVKVLLSLLLQFRISWHHPRRLVKGRALLFMSWKQPVKVWADAEVEVGMGEEVWREICYEICSIDGLLQSWNQTRIIAAPRSNKWIS